MHNSELIQILFLIGFIILIIGLLAIDLGVFEKKDKIVSLKRAAVTTLIWILLAGGYGCIMRFAGEQMHGIENAEALQDVVKKYHSKNTQKKILNILPSENELLSENEQHERYEKALNVYRREATLEFFTGYLIEFSLSLDNIFVMILIFSSFAIPPEYYKRVLMWGILGAIVMRFIFIFAAGALVAKYEWVLIIFGLFLVYSAAKMLKDILQHKQGGEFNPEHNPIVRFFSKRGNVTSTITDHSFVKKIDGKRYVTPLLICLIVIEFSDVLFAIDSIPAIFSITKDPYIVFFSNIFAILGLRSLFFLLSGIIQKFRFLKHGLSVLLFTIGAKMIIESLPNSDIDVPIVVSLGLIVGILTISIILSICIKPKNLNQKN